jgi:hypothetical protein
VIGPPELADEPSITCGFLDPRHDIERFGDDVAVAFGNGAAVGGQTDCRPRHFRPASE